MSIQEKIDAIFEGSYALVDSGGYEKLERFGNKLISRPSSLCLWKKSRGPSDWKKADAIFDPKKGWRFNGPKFDDWMLKSASFSLKLRLQTNGQVGIFPEHAYYLSHIREFMARREGSLNVLNLFAYSGMASIFTLLRGANVCHVDSSKKALDWAKENSIINEIPEGRLRLIADDALGFLKRENRRESKYDIVILDPPSFSRLDGKKTWKLEEVLYEFIENAKSLLTKDALLVFSCHHHALDSRVLRNVFYESGLKIIDSQDLHVTEASSEKMLPAGCNITCKTT